MIELLIVAGVILFLCYYPFTETFALIMLILNLSTVTITCLAVFFEDPKNPPDRLVMLLRKIAIFCALATTFLIILRSIIRLGINF